MTRGNARRSTAALAAPPNGDDSPLTLASSSGRSHLLYGQINGLLLAALARGPLYGAALIDTIATQTGGAVQLTAPGVSQSLRGLEERGLVTAAGFEGRRRIYKLTADGHAALDAHRAHWREYVAVVDAVLGERA